jgi:hypothetical protein
MCDTLVTFLNVADVISWPPPHGIYKGNVYDTALLKEHTLSHGLYRSSRKKWIPPSVVEDDKEGYVAGVGDAHEVPDAERLGAGGS